MGKDGKFRESHFGEKFNFWRQSQICETIFKSSLNVWGSPAAVVRHHPAVCQWYVPPHSFYKRLKGVSQKITFFSKNFPSGKVNTRYRSPVPIHVSLPNNCIWYFEGMIAAETVKVHLAIFNEF